jgi:hypothetical protein
MREAACIALQWTIFYFAKDLPRWKFIIIIVAVTALAIIGIKP